MQEKEKKIFIGLCVGSVLSFLLCGYSLIACFATESSGPELGTYILEVSYLFLHLIFCAIVFYLSLRAVRVGSFFVKNVIYRVDGIVYKNRRIVLSIFCGLFFAIFVYAFIQGILMTLPLANELGKVVWHDIMNGTFLLSIVFFIIVIYPIVPYTSNNKHAE